MGLKNYAGGTSFSNKNGKRKNEVVLRKCWVVPYSTNSLTESMNAELFFIQKLTKTAASPVYLWIYHLPNSDYVGIGFDGSVSNQYDYMKGYPIDVSWKLYKGYYYFESITFKECLN